MNLVPMSRDRFVIYLERLITEYADDKVRAGNWAEEGAEARSRDEIMGLLPQGVATPGHTLFDVTLPEQEEPVGVLWLCALDEGGNRKAFIYDLRIRPDLRRQGLGTQALAHAEAWARSQGLASIALHVFGHAAEAVALYRKAGYQATNILMTKRLP
jgi:ribosomal protein S18 acetylase RimI-like enzyme